MFKTHKPSQNLYLKIDEVRNMCSDKNFRNGMPLVNEM